MFQFVKYQKLLYIDTAVSTEPMIITWSKTYLEHNSKFLHQLRHICGSAVHRHGTYRPSKSSLFHDAFSLVLEKIVDSASTVEFQASLTTSLN